MEEIIIAPPVKVFKEILRENKHFPNNPLLPVLLYKSVLRLSGEKVEEIGENDEEIIEQIFADNEWSNSWRNGIYTFHHYHSTTHEVMGICSGECKVELGGDEGVICTVEKGDVLIIPAGVAHKNTGNSSDFKCIGAYPFGASFDIRYGTAEERTEADKNIENAPFPSMDPVYGKNGTSLANTDKRYIILLPRSGFSLL
jgi:uncharacterized protein YjlB